MTPSGVILTDGTVLLRIWLVGKRKLQRKMIRSVLKGF